MIFSPQSYKISIFLGIIFAKGLQGKLKEEEQTLYLQEFIISLQMMMEFTFL